MPVVSVTKKKKVIHKYVNMNTIEQIARMCHQTNKAWYEINGDTSKKIGIKHSNGRDSAIKGVGILNLTTPRTRRANTMLDGWTK
jgi:hypothetical protein